MRTAQKDSDTLLLHSPEEKAAFYAMETLRNTDQLIRLFTLTLKRRAKTSSASIAAFLTAMGDNAKPLIESRSGHAISSADAAARLKITDETVRTWVKSNRLVGYFDGDEKKKLRLPEWQFSGPNTLHIWVESLIEAFGENGWALLDFMTVPRTGRVADTPFTGESLLQRLQAGETGLVIAAAHRANPT